MSQSTSFNFTGLSVLVVGDVMLDRYWNGGCDRVSPEAPVPIVRVKSVEERLGGAANVAANLSALGVNTILIGAIGEDEAALQFKALLEKHKIRDACITLSDIPTTVKLRVLGQAQQLLRIDFEEKIPDLQEVITTAVSEYLSSIDVVILSDYAKGVLRDPAGLIAHANAANVPVLVDPKQTDYRYYKGATLVKPNVKEFYSVVGECQNIDDIERKGSMLAKAYEIEHLLITRGESGMSLLSSQNAPLHIPTQATEVYDVTGAGDTVISVLAAAMAKGYSVERSAQYANIAAGRVVAKMGTATISAEELARAVDPDIHQGDMLTLESILDRCHEARKKNKRIVFTNGCFDILHAGHVQLLAKAAALGDYLIVAVNSDESVRGLKGPTRPVNNLADRMSVLAGLGCVDWVLSFDAPTPADLISKIQPDVLVKGGDYSEESVVGAQTVKAYGGEVKILPLLPERSTTATIARMRDKASLEA